MRADSLTGASGGSNSGTGGEVLSVAGPISVVIEAVFSFIMLVYFCA
jgi:hypothetical protein